MNEDSTVLVAQRLVAILRQVKWNDDSIRYAAAQLNWMTERIAYELAQLTKTWTISVFWDEARQCPVFTVVLPAVKPGFPPVEVSATKLGAALAEALATISAVGACDNPDGFNALLEELKSQ